MPPKEGKGSDAIAKAVMRRHRRNLAVMAGVLGEGRDSAGFMARRANYYSGYESGIETATCIAVEKVASGELTQAKAIALLAAADKAADED